MTTSCNAEGFPEGNSRSEIAGGVYCGFSGDQGTLSITSRGGFNGSRSHADKCTRECYTWANSLHRLGKNGKKSRESGESGESGRPGVRGDRESGESGSPLRHARKAKDEWRLFFLTPHHQTLRHYGTSSGGNFAHFHALRDDPYSWNITFPVSIPYNAEAPQFLHRALSCFCHSSLQFRKLTVI